MNTTGWIVFRAATLAGLLTLSNRGAAQVANPANPPGEIRVVEVQGIVETLPAGASAWSLTQTNQLLHPLDRLRTAPNSRVALRWSDQSVVPIGAITEIEVLPPQATGAPSGLRLLRGVLSFFHRDQPGRIQVLTRGAAAGVEGTEFAVAVTGAAGNELTTLSVVDGRVNFSNELAAITLTNGQQAVAQSGQAPTRTPGFIANNVLQWCFYYPAVLDAADLELEAAEVAALQASLEAYLAGDLLAALAKYPPDQQPQSPGPRVFHSALLLSVGQSEQAEAELAALPATAPARLHRVAAALRLLIVAVKRQEAMPSVPAEELPTELLARSYYEQSRATGDAALATALDLARQATQRAPEFGFAWARVAELEFSFGHTRQAIAALDRSQELAPQNAQALALRGYLAAAENQTRDAIAWFDRALAVDSALGNAWLGRGLCRLRSGDGAGGREDLLVAAALEPQRAELRNYLGKAFADAGDHIHAARELDLARRLDPNDPTAWLYSALLKQERNCINDAIRDLEKSRELNDNRSLFRSRQLLDQDQAIRSANLAEIYRDAGMAEVAEREAGRALNADYGNYSAHLFLADSFDVSNNELRNRRYETAAAAEYLIANLLAPIGAGPLSPTISQGEYTRLFEQNRAGIISSTEYLSRGAWSENGVQSGTFDQWSYAFDWIYNSDPGQQINGDLELCQLQLKLKFQLAPRDEIYTEVSQLEARYGDLAQHFDPAVTEAGLRCEEVQKPLALVGYHHEWSPGVHTLLALARVEDRVSIANPQQGALLVFRPDDPANPGQTELTGVQGFVTDAHFKNHLEIYSTELQQIWQQPEHQLILGGRYQDGRFQTENVQEMPSIASVFPPLPAPAAMQDLSAKYQRMTLYGHYLWQIAEPLQVIGGIAYDRMTYPANLQMAPLTDQRTTKDALLPKAGLIWKPEADTAVRFGFARSRASASLEQSWQLEPSQVAGFVQSFRSIIPETLVGGNVGAEFECFGLSLEQKLPTETYLGLSAELLRSKLDRIVGAFDVLPDQLDWAIPSGLQEHLDYEERSLRFSVHQLLGNYWSLGLRYRVSLAELAEEYVDVPQVLVAAGNFTRSQHSRAVLHQLRFTPTFNHPSGFFAIGEALWMAQDSDTLADENFCQFNAYLGYRFPRRHAELTLGLLNLSNQDYRLNPLNLHDSLPRDRTCLVRFRLSF